jgi:dipeptidyl aminopeptidase/acylaminoacyl peptidase
MSERDGWNHLWLYDAQSGQAKQQITRGEWVVQDVVHVDAEKRQIWFRAGGVRPGQDPYYTHFCRVNLDGSSLVVLTAGDGTHRIQWSPGDEYFLGTWSRVDSPPVSELRRSSDGTLVCHLEQADAQDALAARGGRWPERFVAKGRDGVTDIYGIIIRPRDFDPSRKYPVVENIYAGPQDYFTPKAFRSRYGPMQQLADRGLIVVQCDGMGTAGRSKGFHDVCFRNLRDAGFPDRIAWMKAAAARFPEMDLTRVGIYGGSAGGQNALAALLWHGDFYCVAVADCGCHDNRMDKIWWNEQWLGWPVGEQYEANSNVVHAHRLQGKLMLIVGELDQNVDPASTMQVVDALEKADKDFDLVIVTGTGHGAAETPYGSRRRADFLVRHLLGEERR